MFPNADTPAVKPTRSTNTHLYLSIYPQPSCCPTRKEELDRNRGLENPLFSSIN